MAIFFDHRFHGKRLSISAVVFPAAVLVPCCLFLFLPMKKFSSPPLMKLIGTPTG
jgi:hypothetical protein